jgi:hypothetical protein
VWSATSNVPPVNCWEFRRCGREPGGLRAAEIGVCPAAEFTPASGFLGGHNGGRSCAFVTGTFCEGVFQGTYRDKSKDCWGCAFYHALRAEHGAAFSMPAFALHLLRHERAAYEAFFADNRPPAKDR